MLAALPVSAAMLLLPLGVVQSSPCIADCIVPCPVSEDKTNLQALRDHPANQKLIWNPRFGFLHVRSKPEARVKALQDLCVQGAVVKTNNLVLLSLRPMYTYHFAGHLRCHISSTPASV